MRSMVRVRGGLHYRGKGPEVTSGGIVGHATPAPNALKPSYWNINVIVMNIMRCLEPLSLPRQDTVPSVT